MKEVIKIILMVLGLVAVFLGTPLILPNQPSFVYLIIGIIYGMICYLLW